MQEETETEPLVTEEPAPDESVTAERSPETTDFEAPAEENVTAAEDPPYVDVVSARRDGRTAILTVNGNETVLTAHDVQSLWRELSAIVPVI